MPLALFLTKLPSHQDPCVKRMQGQSSSNPLDRGIPMREFFTANDVRRFTQPAYSWGAFVRDAQQQPKHSVWPNNQQSATWPPLPPPQEQPVVSTPTFSFTPNVAPTKPSVHFGSYYKPTAEAESGQLTTTMAITRMPTDANSSFEELRFYGTTSSNSLFALKVDAKSSVAVAHKPFAPKPTYASCGNPFAVDTSVKNPFVAEAPRAQLPVQTPTLPVANPFAVGGSSNPFSNVSGTAAHAKPSPFGFGGSDISNSTGLIWTDAPWTFDRGYKFDETRAEFKPSWPSSYPLNPSSRGDAHETRTDWVGKPVESASKSSSGFVSGPQQFTFGPVAPKQHVAPVHESSTLAMSTTTSVLSSPPAETQPPLVDVSDPFAAGEVAAQLSVPALAKAVKASDSDLALRASPSVASSWKTSGVSSSRAFIMRSKEISNRRHLHQPEPAKSVLSPEPPTNDEKILVVGKTPAPRGEFELTTCLLAQRPSNVDEADTDCPRNDTVDLDNYDL